MALTSISAISGRQLPNRLYLGNSALVISEWKLVEGALYDIQNDPYETDDMASDQPSKYAYLTQKAKDFESITAGGYNFQPDG